MPGAGGKKSPWASGERRPHFFKVLVGDFKQRLVSARVPVSQPLSGICALSLHLLPSCEIWRSQFWIGTMASQYFAQREFVTLACMHAFSAKRALHALRSLETICYMHHASLEIMSFVYIYMHHACMCE